MGVSNEGFYLIFDSFFRDAVQPDKFQIGLTTVVTTTLDGDIADALVTDFDVDDGSVFTIVPCIIKVDDEIMNLTGVAGDTLTVERGQEGSTAVSHLSGATVKIVHTQKTTMDKLYEIDNPGGADENGYERKDLTKNDIGFPMLVLDNGDKEISTRQVIFENTHASNSWDRAVEAFICAVMPDTSEKFICHRNLSVERVLMPSEELNVKIKIIGRQP